MHPNRLTARRCYMDGGTIPIDTHTVSTRRVPRWLFLVGGVVLFLGVFVMAGLWNPANAVAFLNALSPRAGVTVRNDLSYGAGPRRHVDVYSPSNAKSAPVVVFFYGGGWEEGDRANYRFVAAAMAASGIVTIVPDYRVYPEVRFPGFVEDAAAATRWARDHAAEFGGDPAKLFLMGHSAGAHIAAMLTFDRHYLGAVGLDPAKDIAGFIGLAGPYDFLPLHSDVLRTIFGAPDTLFRSQPIHYVDGTAPPSLLIAGTTDTTVDPGNTTRLANRIRAKGGEATDILYPNISHALLIGTMARPLHFMAPTFKDVMAFIARTPPAKGAHKR
jgi:acetyl esterase/lipase